MDLWFLDESGFAPTLPTGWTWARVGARAVIGINASVGRKAVVEPEEEVEASRYVSREGG